MSNTVREVITSEDIEDQKFKEILSRINEKIDVNVPSVLSESQFKILSESKIFDESILVFEQIRKIYPDYVIHFLSNYATTYIDWLEREDIEYIEEEVIEFLNSGNEVRLKTSLIGVLNTELSVKKIKYDYHIYRSILTKCFMLDDLQYILLKYNNYSDNIKMIIRELLLDNIDYVIDNEIKLKGLLVYVIYNSENEQEDKMKLLSNNLESVTKDTAKDLFEQVGLENYISLFHNGRPTFKINEINDKLLDALQKQGWISYDIDKNPEYYRAYSRRSTK